MPQLLTKKKSLWVAKRKPQHLRGLALNPNAAIEDWYYQALAAMIKRMSGETLRAIEKFYETPHAEAYFGADASVASQARFLVNKIREQSQGIFNIAAAPIATKMTHAESQSSALTLKKSLEKLSGGLSLKTDFISGDLKEILGATVTENVGLIKSIPQQYFTDIEGAVMRSITTGNGLQDLVPFIQNHEGITLRRARIIARDQTRKAYSNLNFARMERVGIVEYEWLHSAGGQKPRHLHQNMSGNIYRIDQPPVIQEAKGAQREIRGKPGDLINCRCRAIPVLRFGQIGMDAGYSTIRPWLCDEAKPKLLA